MRKSVSFILSILLVLTLCLGGCNPSEPEKPSASLEESSVPEKSSQPEESSVPEESSLVDESSIPEESSQPEESSVPEESSQPEESSVPEESSQPEESFVPDKSSQPEESSASEESAPEESLETIEGVYLEIINDLIHEYGEGTIASQSDPYPQEALVGLVVAKLIDFDQDGQPELFCSYRSMDDAFAPIAHQTVYGVKNGSVQILFHEDAGSKGGANPGSTIQIHNDGTPYIFRYDGSVVDYLTLQDDEFILAHQINYDSSSWDDTQMTSQELSEYLNEFWMDASTPVSVWYLNPDATDFSQILLDTQATIQSLQKMANA